MRRATAPSNPLFTSNFLFCRLNVLNICWVDFYWFLQVIFYLFYFQVGGIGPGTYKLTANGVGGITFSNSTDLEYKHKSLSVFIQTDKAVYKPGQLVRFRVVIVSPQLKPSVIGAFDMHISVSVLFSLQLFRLTNFVFNYTFDLLITFII